MATTPSNAKADAIDEHAKRIAFVSTTLAYGGAETQLLRLATAMVARKWDVRVITMVRPDPFVVEFQRAGVSVASLDMRHGRPDPRALLRLAKLLRRFRPAVVHGHMVHANLLTRVARPLYRAPVVISTVHSTNEGPGWRTIAIRLTDGLCDFTTGVSHAVVARYLRLGLTSAGKIGVVPNGVDTTEFRPSAAVRQRMRRCLGVDERFVWLAVGRIVPEKDYPTLLRAFAELERGRTVGPGAVLLIVGDGSLRQQYESLSARLGIGERVRFLGIRTDVPDVMNAVDGYVLSSAWEGLGVVLQEAAATALPVVATRVGGVPDVVVDERTGYLVTAGDPRALAGQMRRLMELSPAARRQVGLQGREYVHQSFALERVVDRWEELYADLIRKSSSRLLIGADARPAPTVD